MTTEKPVIFNTDMVTAILDGRKSQTRRVMKPQPIGFNDPEGWPIHPINEDQTQDKYSVDGWCKYIQCPYGQIGDQLYVRETWAKCSPVSPMNRQLVHMDRANVIEQPTKDPDTGEWDYNSGEIVIYRADGEVEWCDGDGFIDEKSYWKPSIHMPKKYARIWLEVTNVRVERVQDISNNDACAEGTPDIRTIENNFDMRDCFRVLWDSIYESRGYGWDVNPWVWVVEFKRVEK